MTKEVLGAAARAPAVRGTISAAQAYDDCIAAVREAAARAYYGGGDPIKRDDMTNELRDLVRTALVSTADLLEKMKAIRLGEQP